MTQTIHGDFAVRVAIDTKTQPWTASPSGTVWRKRLHLVGPTESGQVTSIVRYQEKSHFPSHDHPEGEEILVLDGVFSDEHGDWPAGSYLLNPEGFRHAPYSRGGCLLFVKLRQFPGKDRRHVATNTDLLSWHAGQGRMTKHLYEQMGYADSTRLERWLPGSSFGELSYQRGAELLVLGGSFEDEFGDYDAYTWLRLPAQYKHRPRSVTGCDLYIKEGGLTYLRGG